MWLEGKGPDVVIEVTSKTTRREDQIKKRALYQDVLKVPEYFQVDPTEDYLRPPFQGLRLITGRYGPIEPVDGRIPSARLGLLLEPDGPHLRLIDPGTGQRLRPPRERAEAAEAHARAAAVEAIAAEAQARAAGAEAEVDRLRSELEQWKRRLGGEVDPPRS